MYLLDTDTTSEYFRATNANLVQRITALPPSQLFISVVTVEELIGGRIGYVRLCEATKNYERVRLAYDLLLEAFTNAKPFQVQPFDKGALAIFEGYSAAVRRAGANDCKIAAIAAANGWIVVTRNVRHFDKIGVAHEDWAV